MPVLVPRLPFAQKVSVRGFPIRFCVCTIRDGALRCQYPIPLGAPMLDRLTITGPDDKTDIDTLLQLSQYYPFVEWAILYSPTRQGSERYPSEEWRKSFEDACRGTRVKRAMHLCGQAVKDFVEKGPEKVPRRNYQRIQLNFNAKTSTWQKEKNIDWMVNQCSWAEFWDGSPQNVVIQHNHNNAPILPKFERLGSQFHVLYDASGGHGKTITEVPGAWQQSYTGYAGGINPDNAVEIFKKIRAVNDQSFWMDLESGVRTADDQWDPAKVNQLLRVVQPLVGV